VPRVLVFGCRGQVGSELCDILRGRGAEFLAIDREDCDLTQRGSARLAIEDYDPQVIVNAAAYTAVDKAESEPELARALNATAVAEMAQTAAERHILLFHYSTDYIFNGENTRPWREEDAPGPLSVYGQTKLEGERAIAASGAVAFTFRTSWVYGARGANFALTILRLAASRDELSVVSDQIGAPTSSCSLAKLTNEVMLRFCKATGEVNLDCARVLAGVYHATAGGVTNWFEFAKAIVKDSRERGVALQVKNIKPLRTEEYLTAAKRPRYSVLCNRKLNEQLGVQLPHWRDELKAVMKAGKGF
jgi:dTDP-4-dehydrorhamnose reductase